MKLLSQNITPFIYGTWILRITNDINVENNLNFIQINEDSKIKLKTIKQEGPFGVKKSRTASISDVKCVSSNNYNLTLTYSIKNTYSYSFLGIEIPEFKSNSISYDKKQNLSINIFDRSILVIDNKNCLYYIFDLYIGKLKYPNIETNLSTFLFTQSISIILSILITKLL
jgi:hypothetical protein